MKEQFETIRSHSAIVNDGSGVIVQSLSSDYSYILTARHVLKEVNSLTTWEGKKIDALDVFVHEDVKYDCAVIRIPFCDELSLTRFRGGPIEGKAEASLYGFPQIRRNSEDRDDWLKKYDGAITNSVADYHVLTINSLPAAELIEGSSGGGVYSIMNGKPYLIGVQYGMDGPQPEEPGVVRLHDLRLYDSIILANNLAPILPSFFSCFNRVQRRTFSFNSQITGSFDQLKIALWNKISELVNAGAPSPRDILEKYKLDLVVVGQGEQALLDIDLWISYAEFLAIDAIIHDIDRVDIDYLSSIEKVRRLVYSQREGSWLQDFSNILQSARNLLDNGGTLIVASKDKSSDPAPDPELINAIVPNIAAPLLDVDDEEPRIDVGIPGGKIPFKFVLLGGLHQRCISDREMDIRKEPSEKHLGIFRDKYNDIVNWKK